MTRRTPTAGDATLRRRIGGSAVLFAAAVLAGVLALLRVSGSMRADLERETSARFAEQTLADLIHRNVNRQLLAASRYLGDPRPELLRSFRRHGVEVYDLERKYLFHDLSLPERLQVEKVKEIHQEFEVAAQQAFDLLLESGPTSAQERVNSMFAKVAALEEALDRFIAMRVETRTALRERQAGVSDRLHGAAILLGVIFAAALLLFVRFVQRRLLAPLESLSAAARRVSRGELGTRVSFRHRDEFARVAESFNEMATHLAAVQGELENRNVELTGMLSSLEASQADLRASEMRFRSIFDGSPVGLYRAQPDGRFVEVNPALVAMLDYPDSQALLAVNAQELFLDDEARRAWQGRIEGPGAAEGVELRLRRHDGGVIWGRDTARAVRDIDGRLLYCEGALEDVTERRHLEAQLRQALRMEAVGQLAGGIAHDFNNLLTVVKGHAELLLEEFDVANPRRASATEIGRAADRAASLTRQLLAFSRKQVLRPVVLDLNAVVRETEKMLRRLIGEDIRLTAELDPALARVKGDPGQLEQVLVNLAVNARDAMPEGGTLEIRTRNVELAERVETRAPEAVPPGRYVELAVRDTGRGMDDAILGRIFEPFFTTKGPGKGTGLGLATVYGIVRQSGGYVGVQSQPDQGTTFAVYLPQEAQECSALESAAGSGEEPRGSEILLLVEDEPALRRLAERVLTAKGYRVLAAADGHEALRLVEHHDGPIDLLVTDLVMPGMSGRELRDRLLVDRPALKVLVMSGYTEDEVVRRGVAGAGIEFLEKPFTPTVLLRRVREILCSAGGRAESSSSA